MKIITESESMESMERGEERWARWTADDALNRIGRYHPLEPCHARFPRSELRSTLDRMTACFEALPCRVTYDDDGGGGTLSATCLSGEVEFHARLMESRGDAGTVILELQRTAGDALAFHREYARPILAACRVITHDEDEDEDEDSPTINKHEKTKGDIPVNKITAIVPGEPAVGFPR